jgi:hypothetical protein
MPFNHPAACTFALDIWGIKSPPYMQLIFIGFGVGSVITPQIAKPFLPPKANSTDYSQHPDVYERGT